MNKPFDFSAGEDSITFDVAPLAVAPMVVIREAAASFITTASGRQLFRQVCLLVIRGLVAGKVDTEGQRTEIDSLSEVAARLRALELLDLVFQFDALDAAPAGDA